MLEFERRCPKLTVKFEKPELSRVSSRAIKSFEKRDRGSKDSCGEEKKKKRIRSVHQCLGHFIFMQQVLGRLLHIIC
ncbi:hypothetical protein Peur_017650 [Populus x canadensis]